MNVSKEQFAFHLSQGNKLALEGDTKGATEHLEQAEAIKSARDLARKFASMTDELTVIEPLRPTLPGVGTGSLPLSTPTSQKSAAAAAAAAAADVSFMEGLADSSPSSKLPTVKGYQEDEGETESMLNMFYVTKFGKGSNDRVVKSILTDMHGADYQQQYYDTNKAFRHYVKFGDGDMSREERRLLRTAILTPKTIEMGMAQGIENLSVFKATMVESADTLGGALVPVDIDLDMISRLAGYTVVRGRARHQNTNREKVEIPKQLGGDTRHRGNVRVQMVDELPGSISTTNMLFGMESLEVHTMMATIYVSKNNLEDSAMDIDSLVRVELTEEVALKEDEMFLTGSGAGTARGILPGGNNANGYLQTAFSGDANLLTFDGLVSTTYKIDAQYRKNCVWIANKATWGQVALLKNPAGNSYLQTPFQFVGSADGGAGTNMRFLGYPMLESEVMPVATAGSYPILFCDLQGYRIVDRIGMTITRYDDGSTAEQNLIKLVLRRRLGGRPTDPWRFVAHQIHP